MEGEMSAIDEFHGLNRSDLLRKSADEVWKMGQRALAEQQQDLSDRERIIDQLIQIGLAGKDPIETRSYMHDLALTLADHKWFVDRYVGNTSKL
jgi:hypothetical protein